MVLLLSTHLNLTFTMRGKSQVACKLKKKVRIVPSLLNCPCIFTSKSLKKKKTQKTQIKCFEGPHIVELTHVASRPVCQSLEI